MSFDCHNVLDAVNMGLIVVDSQSTILLWNNWVTKHSGISQQTALNQKLSTFFPKAVSPVFLRAVEHTLSYRTSSILSAALHRSPLPLFNQEATEKPTRIYQSITTTSLPSPSGERYCLIQIADASTSIKREKVLRDYSENLKKEAITDGLTGLFNRRFFDEAYKKAMCASRRAKKDVSVFMIDIDFFKLYNDFYGHQAGDVVIQAVASALKSQIVRGEDTVARYGGEEFVVILPNTSKVDAELVAERLNEAVRTLNIPHEKSGAAAFVSISIGICSGMPLNGENMLLKADEALYASKHGGRNRWSSVSL